MLCTILIKITRFINLKIIIYIIINKVQIYSVFIMLSIKVF